MITRTFERGNLIYEISREVDETPDLSWLEQEYADCTPEEQEEYKAQDKKRLDAYNQNEWWMLGVIVNIRVKTATPWARPHVVGSASLWGIESDSDEAYFATVERDLLAEAEEDLKRTREALNA